MTYSAGRRILDADSHLMELPGFLDPHIAPSLIDRLKGRSMERLRPVLDRAVERAEKRVASRELTALAAERLLVDKGWSAMGAFDPAERSRVVDLFGFQGQLVFATFAPAMFLGRDEELLYEGSRAHNRAVAEFCKGDARLLPVGFIPLVDPAKAVELAHEAVQLGCAAIHVPSTAAGERSPSHPDLDPFWAVLAAANVPFVLHVGGGGRLLDRAFHNNAMPVTDHLGGGENIRSKDFLAVNHSPSLLLGVLILDGLFDRFPTLRGGVIEEGASWVVSWMHQLDFALRAFRRTEPPLTRLALQPSEYVRRHLKFTPFPGEPVGWMMEQAGAELFMFSTDYPHPEGGKDPLAKFEEGLGNVAGALVQLAPDLRFVLGDVPEVPSLGPREARARLSLALQRFVRTSATPEHPLVLFIDDLQWADPASLSLLEDLLSSERSAALLAIGAFRSGEVTEDHPLARMLQRLAGHGCAPESLELGPLAAEAVVAQLADALERPADAVLPLAELVERKTGNSPSRSARRSRRSSRRSPAPMPERERARCARSARCAAPPLPASSPRCCATPTAVCASRRSRRPAAAAAAPHRSRPSSRCSRIPSPRCATPPCVRFSA